MGVPSKTTTTPAICPTIVVRVDDHASIVEGTDTVYRYDLPASGVMEGWALGSLIDQVRHLAGPQWPEVEVVIDADEQITELISRTLINKGVPAYPAGEVEEEYEEPPEENTIPAGRHRVRQSEELKIPRPTEGRSARDLGLHPFHGIVLLVLISVVGVSWWTLKPEEKSEPVLPAVSSSAVSTSASSSAPSAPPTTTAEIKVVLEHEQLRVNLPRGYELVSEEGRVFAQGLDENLRVHVKAEPLFGATAEMILAEIREIIAADPQLDGVKESARVVGTEEVPALRYREDPGDGSQVAWTVWVNGEHQMSVGCHTRQAPTVAQQAVCRMAVESLELKN